MNIYLDLDSLDKGKLTSSGSGNYVGRSDKGLTNSLKLNTKRRPNTKHKTRTTNTEVVPKLFMRMLE